jgi:hypothetical protein
MSQDVRETRQNGMDDSTGRMTHYLPKYVSQNVFPPYTEHTKPAANRAIGLTKGNPRQLGTLKFLSVAKKGNSGLADYSSNLAVRIIVFHLYRRN